MRLYLCSFLQSVEGGSKNSSATRQEVDLSKYLYLADKEKHLRVKENPGESLVALRGKLFCNSCREEVSLKSSSIKNHTCSAKHHNEKKRLKRKEKREQEIAVARKAHNADVHLVREGVPVDRSAGVPRESGDTFLCPGVPLNKVEAFRELLEEGAYRLSGQHSLSDLIPFILKREKAQVTGGAKWPLCVHHF